MKLIQLGVFTVVCALVTPAQAGTAAGTDFAAQAIELYTVAACGGDAPPKHVAHHCDRMDERYASYKQRWVDPVRAFIAEILPTATPDVVVYPFGGGDLSSALTVFPDATELTTLSLEAAGDVRVIDTIGKARLKKDLAIIGKDIGRLYRAAHSTTKSLQTASHARLPGSIVFALAALVVHGHRPVSLRYFTLEADGAIHYLTEAELDDAVAKLTRKKKGKRSKHFWREQDSPFANVEIEFVPVGDPKATPRVYRHIVANLDDEHLAADDRVIKHLAAKGKVAAMTKAASFLLWYDDFTTIRGYLLDHMAMMISDSSGIGPSDATAAGFEQVTFGSFKGPYFAYGRFDTRKIRREMVKLWKTNPKRALPFRFGYPDSTKGRRGHLMITQPTSCAGKVPC